MKHVKRPSWRPLKIFVRRYTIYAVKLKHCDMLMYHDISITGLKVKTGNIIWISAMESRRGALLSALSSLRLAHPALPQLRDFQVSPCPFHAISTKQPADLNVFSWTSWNAPSAKTNQTTSSVPSCPASCPATPPWWSECDLNDGLWNHLEDIVSQSKSFGFYDYICA